MGRREEGDSKAAKQGQVKPIDVSVNDIKLASPFCERFKRNCMSGVRI